MPQASAQLARDYRDSWGNQLKLPRGKMMIFYTVTMQERGQQEVA